jgi:hypothetical protein
MGLRAGRRMCLPLALRIIQENDLYLQREGQKQTMLREHLEQFTLDMGGRVARQIGSLSGVVAVTILLDSILFAVLLLGFGGAH